MKDFKKTMYVIFAVLAVCLIAAAVLSYSLLNREVQKTSFEDVADLTLTSGILFGKDTAKIKLEPESPCTVKVTMNCQYLKDHVYYWTGEKTETFVFDETSKKPHTLVIKQRGIAYAEAVVEVTYSDGTSETRTLSLSC